MSTEQEEESQAVIASSEPARNHEPSPYMTYDVKAKKARYFVEVQDGKNRPTIELTRDEYRDVVATLALDVQHELKSLLDSINHQAVGNWIDRMTEE